MPLLSRARAFVGPGPFIPIWIALGLLFTLSFVLAPGSFIGAFAGALLLQVIIQSTSFLDFGRAWQFWLPGILILVAAAAYSRARLSLQRRST